MKRILTINPGSTSTKTALFEAADSWNVDETLRGDVKHDPAQLEACRTPADGLALRADAVESFLKEAGNPDLSAIAGRGGITRRKIW